MADLRACPFCGKTPPARYYVGCDEHTKFMRPEQWNRRVLPPSLRALVEAARKLVNAESEYRDPDLETEWSAVVSALAAVEAEIKETT